MNGLHKSNKKIQLELSNQNIATTMSLTIQARSIFYEVLEEKTNMLTTGIAEDMNISCAYLKLIYESLRYEFQLTKTLWKDVSLIDKRRDAMIKLLSVVLFRYLPSIPGKLDPPVKDVPILLVYVIEAFDVMLAKILELHKDHLRLDTLILDILDPSYKWNIGLANLLSQRWNGECKTEECLGELLIQGMTHFDVNVLQSGYKDVLRYGSEGLSRDREICPIITSDELVCQFSAAKQIIYDISALFHVKIDGFTISPETIEACERIFRDPEQLRIIYQLLYMNEVQNPWIITNVPKYVGALEEMNRAWIRVCVVYPMPNFDKGWLDTLQFQVDNKYSDYKEFMVEFKGLIEETMDRIAGQNILELFSDELYRDDLLELLRWINRGCMDILYPSCISYFHNPLQKRSQDHTYKRVLAYLIQSFSNQILTKSTTEKKIKNV
jgi:hypothetical protein